MHGDPAFFEIGVPDSARARAFYGRLFHWEFPPFGENGQVWIRTPRAKGGLHEEDPSAPILMFFEVDDIEAAVRTVRELGGSAEDPGPEESGLGRFAMCVDDQGVRFGLHRAAG
ncbi:VOC family protein [Embleya sp. NBC_00896]|uniref:VOC family protein n=1 Tax=Embleya sp. NBC_00896 TaxID=2975961 RepID=UPI00386C26A1|nr:VOC family protein [Embleya sp. NBC_00896]